MINKINNNIDVYKSNICNFTEVTHYKMLNIVRHNKGIKIIAVMNSSATGLNVFEFDANISNDQLRSLIEQEKETRLFIRESDYKELCLENYPKEILN